MVLFFIDKALFREDNPSFSGPIRTRGALRSFELIFNFLVSRKGVQHRNAPVGALIPVCAQHMILHHRALSYSSGWGESDLKGGVVLGICRGTSHKNSCFSSLVGLSLAGTLIFQYPTHVLFSQITVNLNNTCILMNR